MALIGTKQAANAEFRQLIQNAPTNLKKQLLGRWRDLRSQKARDMNGEVDSTVLRSSLNDSIEAIVTTILPSGGLAMIPKAQQSDIDLITYLQNQKPDAAAATLRTRATCRRQHLIGSVKRRLSLVVS